MTPLDTDRLGSTHPELFEPPFSTRLRLQTLSDLKLRFADDARAQGYVCVRHPHTVRGRAVPGLWIAPFELPTLEALLPEVEAFRAAREAERAARAQAEAVEKRARRQRAVVEAIARRAHAAPEDVEARLGPDLVQQLAETSLAPVEAYVRSQRPTFRGQPLAEHAFEFDVGEAVLRPTGADHLRALLDGGPPALEAVLEADYAALTEAARELVDKWEPSRPAWFSAASLERWAMGAVSADRYAKHPLLSLGPVRETLSAEPLMANGTAYFAEFRTKIDADDVLEAMWRVAEFPKGKIVPALKQVMSDVASRPVYAAGESFLASHPYEDVDSALEFTPEEWRETVLRAFGQAIDFKWKAQRAESRAEQRLSEAVAVRKLELSARRARRELPERLRDFYPLARSLRRRLTFLMGPTNSGKTHRALERLKAAPDGAYFGPLRLLALEVYERLNEDGVPTSLVTGELIETVEGARHVAATVEMMDVSRAVDTAVIDEIQMLEDRDRGSAWLHAALGCPAKHVIMVGAAAALPVVRALAEVTGEPLEVVALERLNPLTVLKKPTRLDSLERGSALVVFSRQAALSLAQHLREDHGRRVSVIYGALSPEVRREQARMFREGETDVVVATDAIGMGLNLPIRTLLFTTAIKWNGETEEPIGRSLTWQIAGRAGRYGLHEAGYVGALDYETLDHVREMLSAEPSPVEFPLSYGLTLPIAQAIGRQLGTSDLSLILSFFATRLTLEDWAVPQSAADEAMLASFLQGAGLRLETQLTLSHAPATSRDEVNEWFEPMVRALIAEDPREVRLLDTPLPAHDLRALEERVRDLTLYSWMHYRFGEVFPRVEDAQAQLKELNARIVRELAKGPGRRCSACNAPMAWNSEHSRCESCFRSRRFGRGRG
jgi:hypothetical protein